MPLDSEKAMVIGVHIGVPSDFELGVPLDLEEVIGVHIGVPSDSELAVLSSVPLDLELGVPIGVPFSFSCSSCRRSDQGGRTPSRICCAPVQ